jgi:3-phytase
MKYLIYSFLLFISFSCSNNNECLSERDVFKDTLNPAVIPAVITEKSMNDTDDPAIWINKSKPSESLILGTDKGDATGGIYVYNLDGKIDSTKSVFDLKRPNNIDIEYGFKYKGKTIDIAVFTERGRNMIRVFQLPEMKAIDNGGIEVFTGETCREPMGISLYRKASNNSIYAIVSRKKGASGSYLWEYLLAESDSGYVTGKKLRAFGNFSGKKEIEAVVVDDELGYVYYSDERVGIHQYYADPDSSNTELALFATSGVRGDHEGISIYPTSKTEGYILLSDQQANRFQIFTREGCKENPYNHKLVKIVNVKAMESDGNDVTPLAMGPNFPHGLFVVMSTDRTFHFYKWEDIAGKNLKVITK